MDDHDLAALLHLGHQGLAKGDPIAPAIVPSSMYHQPGTPEGMSYGRTDNPSWLALEAALSHLEDAPAIAFPSGMAAITAALMATLRAGDRLLIPSDGYYTPRLLADRVLSRLGVTTEQRPIAAFAEGGFAGFAVILVETPSNPGLDLCDLAAVAEAARAAGARLIADNTTMTPLGQRPLDLGVDIIVAADTKAPGGHSDLLMGHAASRDPALMEAIRDWRTLSGSIPSPFDAVLALRGLQTLELRLARMWESAAAIAPRLTAHPAVRMVTYPGLPDHPQAALAKRQMSAPGFLIGFDLGRAEAADAFIAACPLLAAATSFGGVHSSAERRARWGDAVPEGFVRLSVGCEPTEALWAALEHALDSLPQAGRGGSETGDAQAVGAR